MDPLGVIGSQSEGKGTSNFISDSFLLFRYSRATIDAAAAPALLDVYSAG